MREHTFVYVTEICQHSQRKKQNCRSILRLRDFVVSLKAGKCLLFAYIGGAFSLPCFALP